MKPTRLQKKHMPKVDLPAADGLKKTQQTTPTVSLKKSQTGFDPVPVPSKEGGGEVDAHDVGDAQALSATQSGVTFDSFLKVKTFDVEVSRPGGLGTERVSVNVLTR